jgi:hypothetical protein
MSGDVIDDKIDLMGAERERREKETMDTNGNVIPQGFQVLLTYQNLRMEVGLRHSDASGTTCNK